MTQRVKPAYKRYTKEQTVLITVRYDANRYEEPATWNWPELTGCSVDDIRVMWSSTAERKG